MSDRLEEQLTSLSARLDVEGSARLIDDVLNRLDDSPPRRRVHIGRRSVVAAAALVAAAVLLVMVLPGPRRTVAHWFGIGSTRIDGSSSSTASSTTPSMSTTPPPTTPIAFPSVLHAGAPTTASDASARTGLPVPQVPALGEPAGIFVVSPPASGQVMVVYPPSASLPASPVAGVGALLSTMPGTIDDGLFLKAAGAGTTIETFSFVTSTGTNADAIWLSGVPHTYAFQDRTGSPVFDTLRLATNTLLWQQDGVSYRLEANIPRDQAVQLAATVTSS